MHRWAQITEALPDGWYDEAAKSVCKPAIYKKAANALISGDKPTEADFDLDADGYKDPTDAFIDHMMFDGAKPNAYFDSLTIGLKADQTIADDAVQN